MPSISYGSGAYRRDDGNLPTLRLINMFVEQAKTSENQVALISRPGLGLLVTNGSGPINGMFSKNGTLNGDVFSISNTALYRGTSAITSGTIAGTGPARFAGSDTELVVTRGTVARSYNGTNIQNITFPDTANVRAVTYIGSLFVYVRDASAKFYWSTPLDGRTIDALDFATAEREPDQLLDIEALGDNIWLFGQQTVEAWSHTGEADLPFTRVENVFFTKGIMATGCVVPADNSLFFIGSDRTVYRVDETPIRISDHGIEERILGSTTARMLRFNFEGHEFVVIRLDTQTLAYDCATQEWCEFQTNGGQWIVAHTAMVDKIAYLGHETTGELMGWSEWDDMGVEMERLFTAAVPLDGNTPVGNVRLWANAGHADLGLSPVVEMRSSRDGGNSWGDWKSASLGSIGQYRKLPAWRRCGTFDFPGAMFEFRVTDPVPFRVSAVKVNDPLGGRSRA